MKAFLYAPEELRGYNRSLLSHNPELAGRRLAFEHRDPMMGDLPRFSNVTGFHGTAIADDVYEFTSAQRFPLGTMAITRDGRWYRYAQAGAVDLVPGTVCQSAAPIANHLGLTAAATAVGATQLTITPGATAGAANLYAEGYLNISVAPGPGRFYRISGHPAIVASTAFILTLDPDDAIELALTTSSRHGLIHNPYKNVIIHPSPATSNIAGVAVAPVTATYYGWLQTRGLASVLTTGTPAINAPVIVSATVDGSVDVWTAAAAPTAITVGRMAQVGVNGEYDAVYLTID